MEDNIWLFGSNSINFSNYKGYAYGNTILDFSNGEPRVYYDSIMTLDFSGTNASICDGLGKLMFYTNGMQIHNNRHQIVRKADTIAYSPLWEYHNVKDYPFPGQNWIAGLKSIQGALFLPWPDNPETFAVFYSIATDNAEFITFGRFSFAKIEADNSKDIDTTIFKDRDISKGEFISGMINACRHANGRDWWIVNRSRDRQFLYVYLFDPSGVKLVNTIEINNKYKKETSKVGQLYFSPNGDKMAIAESIVWPFDSIYLDIYNFNRVIGEVNLLIRDTIKNNKVQGTLAFSPDGKYLYASNHLELFQYDLTAVKIKSSVKKIANFDGFKFKYNEFDPGVPTTFGGMAHGPDGKIYIAPESSNRYLHTIEYPEEEGLETNVIQRKFMLPTSNHVAIPNFPHFRLGPLDYSLADTLGLNNNPIAKFRYETDTLDHLNIRFTDLSYYRPETWHWGFGDGTTFDGKKPYWHTFSKNGTYNVCLTVSNENSSNTICRLLTIGSVNNNETIIKPDVVSVFPNPVETEMLITISEYIPEHGIIEIYDELGKKCNSQRVYYGWNNIDMTNYPDGIYLYTISDGLNNLGRGKIVKL